MDAFTDILCRGADELAICLDQTHIEQFAMYCSMLTEWNERMNLTAILEPKEIAVKHFIDSLALLKAYHMESGARVIDVGTGAGFPGIPLKIIRPDLNLVLLDSLHKRTQFLQAVVEKLILTNTIVVHGRAEERGQDAKFREAFDIVLSRAVAPLTILSELCLPFVRLGGHFLAMKGPEVQEEIMQAQVAISTLGGAVCQQNTYNLPISQDPRSLVIIEKISTTPVKYPRRPGMPEKKPLR